MKTRFQMWTKLIVLFLYLCVLVAGAMFPLVFSEAVLANFLSVLEVLARAR